jgi:hypothetical protein
MDLSERFLYVQLYIAEREITLQHKFELRFPSKGQKVSAMSDGFHMRVSRTGYYAQKQNIKLCSNY